MTCREAQARITGYLDGDLDAHAGSAVRGHLRACASCRAIAGDHAAIRDQLAGLGRSDPPAALWNGVLSRLAAEEVADAKRSRLARWLAPVRPHLVPAGLAIGVCAAAALLIQYRGAKPLDLVNVSGPVSAAVVDGIDRGSSATATLFPERVRVDATAELIAENERIDARYRAVATDLLATARSELGARSSSRRRFDREVAVFERAVLKAVDSRARDRAWHRLLSFVERATLGERLAELVR